MISLHSLSAFTFQIYTLNGPTNLNLFCGCKIRDIDLLYLQYYYSLCTELLLGGGPFSNAAIT